MTGYAELCATSNFTFLTGASHPEELVTRAAELGLEAIAITDRNSLAGVVRAHCALRELQRMRAEGGSGPTIRGQRTYDDSARTVKEGPGLGGGASSGGEALPLPRLIVGTRLVPVDGVVEWLALPEDRAGYERLSQLLSQGKRRAPKGECHLRLDEIAAAAGRGLVLVALPPDPLPAGRAPSEAWAPPGPRRLRLGRRRPWCPVEGDDTPEAGEGEGLGGGGIAGDTRAGGEGGAARQGGPFAGDTPAARAGEGAEQGWPFAGDTPVGDAPRREGSFAGDTSAAGIEREGSVPGGGGPFAGDTQAVGAGGEGGAPRGGSAGLSPGAGADEGLNDGVPVPSIPSFLLPTCQIVPFRPRRTLAAVTPGSASAGEATPLSPLLPVAAPGSGLPPAKGGIVSSHLGEGGLGERDGVESVMPPAGGGALFSAGTDARRGAEGAEGWSEGAPSREPRQGQLLGPQACGAGGSEGLSLGRPGDEAGPEGLGAPPGQRSDAGAGGAAEQAAARCREGTAALAQDGGVIAFLRGPSGHAPAGDPAPPEALLGTSGDDGCRATVTQGLVPAPQAEARGMAPGQASAPSVVADPNEPPSPPAPDAPSPPPVADAPPPPPLTVTPPPPRRRLAVRRRAPAVASDAACLWTPDQPDPAPAKRSRSRAERTAEALARAPAEAGAGAAEIALVAARHPGGVHLGAVPRWDGQDRARLRRLDALARRLGIPMVAAGDVLMHRAHRRAVADVLSCIRLGLTMDSLGLHALPNAERRLKDGAEMARLFAEFPQAVARTTRLARRCRFSLDELAFQYPDEVAGGEPPQERLARLTAEGLARRYPRGVPPAITARVVRELELIGRLQFAPYFLTVADIVDFARSRGILCQGRGSAANSVICYVLGITEVPPERISMVFERFISEARGEPPDIDVDFEHERREEVIQHIYAKYGRHRAGLTATVIHFRARAAVREVGRAMGLSDDTVAAITAQSWGWSSSAPTPEKLAAAGLDASDPRLARTVHLIGEIIGFPRHLSQHVGGFVVTRGRLDAFCPIENAAMEDRTIIEWDKNDIDALGILKVDVLALGMLTVVRKCFDLIAGHGGPRHDLASLPPEDPSVYDMLCRADAIGVFQVESRAQLNFLPRLKPREFYDLVIEVAIVRPGPIQGGMVHPYLLRRQGKEPVDIPSPELREVLWRTKGIPLFQEQAMQIAIVGAGFDPGEADRLRRSLATFRRMGTIGTFRDRFMAGMAERGHDPDFAARCFAQIEGFGEYGFPESHAASFANLVYASAWMKRHHQAAFTCALLNSQPMGFYAPAQLVRDAREHGVEVRPVCVEASHWDCTLEPRRDGALALRLGLRQVKGLAQEDADWIVAARANGYADVAAVWRRAGVQPAALERLAEADAFASLGLGRREALWQVQALGPKPLPLFDGLLEGEAVAEPPVALPQPSEGEAVLEDYLSLRLSLRAHPMAILRPALTAARGPCLPCGELPSAPPRRTTVTGLVITRQRPGTASGVIFLTLEDETGNANVIVWARVYQRFRAAVIAGRLLRVTGLVQREGAVTHLIAETVEDLSAELGRLRQGLETRADESGASASRTPRQGPAPHPRLQAKHLFPSRDFH